MSRPPIRSNMSGSAASPQDTPSPDEDERTVVDDMADDAAGQAVRPESTLHLQLWPYAALPRRTRADFYNRIRSLGALGAMGKPGAQVTADSFDSIADFYTVVADAEDALRVVAHPSTLDRFEAWVADAEDADVVNLLMWYMSTFQVGEAKGS